MKAPMLIAGLLLLSPISNTNSITLDDANHRSQVITKITSNGKGHSDKCMQLHLTNNSGSNTSISIPAGQMFIADNDANQNMMVTQPVLVSLPKGKSKTVDVFAMCTESSDRSPSEGDTYQMGKKATGDLLACANYIAKNNVQTVAGQHAVWTFTDDLRIEGIFDRANPEQSKQLAKFVAEKKGVKVPWYNLLYKEPEGNTPFIEEVVDIKGTFNFKLPKKTKVSLAMYDEDGNEVVNYFTNQWFPAYTSYIDFAFKAENFNKGKYYFNKGKYYFRLKGNNRTIEEKEMVI